MRRVAFAAIAVACAACSAIAGLDEDYIVGIATPALDAGSDAVDAAVTPIDASPGDAGPFCTGTSLFCTDFEGDAGIDFTFGRTEATGGPPRIVEGLGIGESRAFQAVMTAPSTGTTAATVAWRTVATDFPVGTTLTLRFSFVVRAKETDYAAIAVIQFGDREHGLAMYDRSKCGVINGACLDENDPSGRPHDANGALALVPGTWHEGLVSLSRNATGYAGRVEIDGKAVDDRPTGAMPVGASTTKIEVGIGSFFSSGGGTNDVVVDNVSVTRQ